MTKIDPPFLVAGDVTTGETKVLQLAVQGDTRYELSIKNNAEPYVIGVNSMKDKKIWTVGANTQPSNWDIRSSFQ